MLRENDCTTAPWGSPFGCGGKRDPIKASPCSWAACTAVARRRISVSDFEAVLKPFSNAPLPSNRHQRQRGSTNMALHDQDTRSVVVRECLAQRLWKPSTINDHRKKNLWYFLLLLSSHTKKSYILFNRKLARQTNKKIQTFSHYLSHDVLFMFCSCASMETKFWSLKAKPK